MQTVIGGRTLNDFQVINNTVYEKITVRCGRFAVRSELILGSSPPKSINAADIIIHEWNSSTTGVWCLKKCKHLQFAKELDYANQSAIITAEFLLTPADATVYRLMYQQQSD